LVSFRLTGTPVAGLILIHPGVQFKTVKSDGLLTEGNFSDIGSNHVIEFVAVHTQVGRGIAQPDQSRQDLYGMCFFAGHGFDLSTQIDVCDRDAAMTELFGNLQTRLAILLTSFTLQFTSGRTALVGRWPAGQFAIPGLCVGMP